MATPDPLKTPIQTRPTPVRSDTLFWEMVSGVELDGNRLDYGSDHPDTAKFPNFKLCKEERESLALGKRWWASEFTLQDTYNDAIEYGEEDVNFPKFVRRYSVLRDKYVPRTTMQPLPGFVLTAVSSTGQDYTEAPAISFAGGTGAGGAIRAIINASGEVCQLVIDDPGAWTSAPVLVFIGGNGTGAAGTVILQPQNALLVHQSKIEYPDDDPRHSIFVIQECVYETLPGRQIVTPGWDVEDGGLTKDYSQLVALPADPISKGTEYPAASGYFVVDSTVTPFRSPRYNVNPAGEGSVVGTLIVKTKKLPQPSNALALAGYSAQYPTAYDSVPDPVSGTLSVVVKRVVPAGTIGGIIKNNAKAIVTIAATNPGKITTDIAHFFQTGDSVIIAGVSGNTPGINGTNTITVVDELNFTLNGVHITGAGSGGTVLRTKDTDAYVEVQATEHEWGSIQLRSFVEQSTVLGVGGWVSYPVTVQFKKPDLVSDARIFLSSGGNDAGANWTITSGERGEWKGMASEGYFTPVQLAAFVAAYPIPIRFQDGAEIGDTITNGSGSRLWTFRIPTSGILLEFSFGPNGGRILHITGDQIKLGIFRITLVEIFLT